MTYNCARSRGAAAKKRKACCERQSPHKAQEQLPEVGHWQKFAPNYIKYETGRDLVKNVHKRTSHLLGILSLKPQRQYFEPHTKIALKSSPSSHRGHNIKSNIMMKYQRQLRTPTVRSISIKYDKSDSCSNYYFHPNFSS